ncbi:hypothetical protein FEM48_Zijuj08G0109200 [Ziziphus jujuba var. spinosa]|uniref:TF-B3 domain-containing protein n=1 Tax=Ziziphus jujuba var. spinosa TaxID=714518 RepID=A0A978UYP4_ZIZJJ|nr:hypothetical protein FEM48_Zijuj08G0109200 [Ziziphus jujuba var. spinosa]
MSSDMKAILASMLSYLMRLLQRWTIPSVLFILASLTLTRISSNNLRKNDVSDIGEKSSLQCLRPHKRMKTSSPNSKVVGKKKQHFLSSIEKAGAVEIAVCGFKSVSLSSRCSYFLFYFILFFVQFIPKKFAKRYTNKKEGVFTLWISEGRTWSVRYKTRIKSDSGQEITEISDRGGWNAFARDNNLEVIDVCIFELITSGNDISDFRVSIIRRHDHISPV